MRFPIFYLLLLVSSSVFAQIPTLDSLISLLTESPPATTETLERYNEIVSASRRADPELSLQYLEKMEALAESLDNQRGRELANEHRGLIALDAGD
jgi:hypothetical protein